MARIKAENIRNFCIIAHIDHGKSTLADRMLEFTGTVQKRQMQEQLLDDMELERQRGITIKARAVAMRVKHGGQDYELNLIDTPGHVDFQYEVSRSLTCCEGALLLADAFQGVEAQTVATGYAAIEHNLDIIPVINKIDLQYQRSDEVAEEMEHALGIDISDVVKVSAKSGINIRWPDRRDHQTDQTAFGRFQRHAASHGLRFALRRIPWCDHVRANHERDRQKGGQDPVSPGRNDA